MDQDAPRHMKLGRRIAGRHAAVARASGLRLGSAVASRHQKPEPVRAAMRLVPKPAGLARAAAAPAPAAGTPEPEPAQPAWTPSPTDSTVMPGISDWAAD